MSPVKSSSNLSSARSIFSHPGPPAHAKNVESRKPLARMNLNAISQLYPIRRKCSYFLGRMNSPAISNRGAFAARRSAIFTRASALRSLTIGTCPASSSPFCRTSASATRPARNDHRGVSREWNGSGQFLSLPILKRSRRSAPNTRKLFLRKHSAPVTTAVHSCRSWSPPCFSADITPLPCERT